MVSRNFDLSQTPSDSILIFPDVPASPPSAGSFLGAVTSSTKLAQLGFFAPGAVYVPFAGGTMTGPLVLSQDPTVALGAATKQYADKMLPLAGGQMIGPLSLAGDGTQPLHAATKQQVDGKLAIAGGTMTGNLTLAGDPATSLHSATKQYVDNQLTTAINGTKGVYLPLVGGTLTGAVAGPVFQVSANDSWSQPSEADFVWSVRDAAGNIAIGLDPSGMFTAAVTLPADPTANLQAATKQYVDNQRDPPGTWLALIGGTLTGPVLGPSFAVTTKDAWTSSVDPDMVWSVRDGTGNVAILVDATGSVYASSVGLSADPTTSLQAATKQYVDAKTATAGGNFLPLAGGTLTGPVTAPTYNVGVNDTWTTSTGPDLAFTIRDGSGNIAAAVLYDGTLSISQATVATALILPSTAPTNPNAAVSKSYVDANAMPGGPFLPTSGGTMLGPIVLAADPAADMQAVTKQYADSLTAGSGGPYLSTKGGTMTGAIVIPDNIGLIASTGSPGTDTNNFMRLITMNSLTPGIAIGPRALWNVSSASNGSMGIGYMAGGGAVGGMSGSENTCIGYFAGRSITTGAFCTAVGLNALGLETGLNSSITAIGNDTMRDSVGCDSGTAVGKDAHRGWDAKSNTVVGTSSMAGGIGAGVPHAVGAENVAVGYRVMRASATATLPAGTVTASHNVALGSQSMLGDNLASASDNVAVGYQAGMSLTVGNQNILSGSGVATTLTSGSGNTLLGVGVAKSLTTGSNNIILAAGNATIDVGAPGESGTLRIGAHLVNTIRATGIDTSAPKLFFDWLSAAASFASDSAAAAGGVAVNQLYRNGSQVMVRVS